MAEVDLIADGGAIADPLLLHRVEPIHRQLRPQLPSDYAGAMQKVFDGGAGMAAAVVDGAPRGVIVWRVYRNTSKGLRLYVDDLVVDEAFRGSGVGAVLLDWIETRARALGCDALELDSGVHRDRAHRFYFRSGFHIRSFAFTKLLKSPD